VENGGLIQADGGLVLMTAQGAGNLLSTVVNNTGVIRAQTLSNINGTIKLLADMGSGTVNVSGTLDASGRGAGQTGGRVTATAHHVGLFSGHIDASGDAGGGTVLVGGGYQGNNPSVQNASATYMSADSTISADAITNGNGGTAVLWSNDSTRAYGSITARGGAQGGDGGLIETSGHWLDVTGIQINASATNGKNGMWLLDPADVTISADPPSNATLTAGVFSPDSGQGSANINAGALQVLLNGGTNVTITTTNTGASGTPLSGRGDINVNAPLTWTIVGAAPSTTLTLNAVGDVNIKSAITTTQGNLVVCCGRDVNVTAAITLTRGSMLLSAGRDVNQNAAIVSKDGNVAMCAGRDINVLAPLSSERGTVDARWSLANLGVRQGLSFIAGNAATGPGLAGGGGAVNIAPPGGTVTVVQSAVVGEEVPVTVFYNPVSYSAPVVDYASKFSTFNPLTVRRLVFPSGADKTFDGTTAATFTSLKADSLGNFPTGVTLSGTGTFDNTAVGVGKIVTFSGLTLGGGSATSFALPADCCGPTIGKGRTTANITPVAVPGAGTIGGIVAGIAAGTVAVPVAVPLAVPLAEEFEEGSTFFLPLVPPRTARSTLLTASLESPPSMVLVESRPELPPETLVAVPPEVPPPYVAPVRPRKQGRQ
jgi:hypothetical protein